MIYSFPEFSPAALAAYSSREFEASRNLPSFLEAVGIRPERICLVKQIHGSEVISATQSFREREGDAVITRKRNLALVIRTADCVPIFLLEPQVRAIGICHAGWRGVKAGVVLKTLEKLRDEFGAKLQKLRVAIGPAIRKDCYEVGPEFEDYFPGWVHGQGKQWFFDLVGLIGHQLMREGVSEASIHDSKICTACSTDRFFSARREGQETGRFLSAIYLK